MPQVRIGSKIIGDNNPTYFIADIAANHDGDLERAISLIHLAKEAGADAAKFQNFNASKIVSDYGFKNLGSKQAHQSSWKKSVFEVYKDYSIPKDWTPVLRKECDKIGIDYFSSPYDFESVDHLFPYVDVYKIGSGDITWLEMLRYIAGKGKPLILATGASAFEDVDIAVNEITKINKNLVIMQCNTNYCATDENYKYVNLKVIQTYKNIYPNLVIGLSDHTFGSVTTLGAVALGARIIEKHFTDDNNRTGPDHKFAMNPETWKNMVRETRILEAAFGDGIKRVEVNEKESIVVQQRSLRAARDLLKGEVLKREDIDVLRPAPEGCIKPQYLSSVIGKKIMTDICTGDIIRITNIL